MSTVYVCASRTFAPLSAVDKVLQELPADSTLIALGSTQVSRRAVLVATSLDMHARNVTFSRDRSELVAAARNGDTVLIFTATDPTTKQITEGMGQLTAYLDSQSAAYRQIPSPLPGRVCEAMSMHRRLVEEALETRNERRQIVITNRALKANTKLLELREEYEQRMTESMRIRVGDEVADNKWCYWLSIYEALCDELDETKALLTTRTAA